MLIGLNNDECIYLLENAGKDAAEKVFDANGSKLQQNITLELSFTDYHYYYYIY